MGLEMPGIKLVNSGLLGLHHICLERGRDRQKNTCRDFDRQTARQRNAIDTHNLRVFNIRGSVPIPCKITTLLGDLEPLKFNSMLGYQVAFCWRADDGPLKALSPYQLYASIRIDSLFVVTIRIDWYVSVYRSFRTL